MDWDELQAPRRWTPTTRTLLQVTVEEAALADEIMSMLMGDDVEMPQAVHPDQRQRRAVPGHLSDRRPSEHDRAADRHPDTRRPDDGDGDADQPVQPIQLQDEMERSFLDYAMSVIMSRALPDVRDGLKPVHRRIIWDMEEQGFRPDRPFVKSARVTGDTMAKYHPHGDGAIYDALVRMAQPFSLRHPLIDFHGNYGCARLRAGRRALHRVPPAPAGDAAARRHRRGHRRHRSPTTTAAPRSRRVLPARFPNLLVNGSQGIAVGMATNIPPHNLGEVIDATVHLIDNPEATPDDLMQFVKGPDFPTGGSILGRAGIIDAYRTGRGSVKMRATAHRGEHDAAASRSSSPSCRTRSAARRSPRRIQELVDGGDLDGIADVNDETSGARPSLVITLKRDANANVVLNNLFKLTQLQTSFGVNMVALVDGVPRTLNLAQALQGYVDHQVEVITRRTRVPPRQGAATGRTSSRAASRRSTSSTRSSPSSGQRRRRRGQGRSDGRAVRVQRAAGRPTSSRCSSRQLTRLTPHRPRDRARRRARAASPSSRRSSPTTRSCAA